MYKGDELESEDLNCTTLDKGPSKTIKISGNHYGTEQIEMLLTLIDGANEFLTNRNFVLRICS